MVEVFYLPRTAGAIRFLVYYPSTCAAGIYTRWCTMHRAAGCSPRVRMHRRSTALHCSVVKSIPDNTHPASFAHWTACWLYRPLVFPASVKLTRFQQIVFDFGWIFFFPGNFIVSRSVWTTVTYGVSSLKVQLSVRSNLNSSWRLNFGRQPQGLRGFAVTHQYSLEWLYNRMYFVSCSQIISL